MCARSGTVGQSLEPWNLYGVYFPEGPVVFSAIGPALLDETENTREIIEFEQINIVIFRSRCVTSALNILIIALLP